VAEHDPTAYGRHIADDYDRLYERLAPDTDQAVACLAELAAGGPVLELGVGTGRLALPLAARGLSVHGVDASPEMVARLRAKPGGDRVAVELADFTTLDLGTEFALVLLAVNTIYALPSQDAQVAVFQTAARHLRPGGVFVVDAWVPDLGRFRGGQALRVLDVAEDAVVVEAALLDPVGQRMTTTKVVYGDDRVRLFPANHRYAWPAELDLMARIAGLRLRSRWSGWDRRPFTADSTMHVSVWARPGPPSG
jgi:SAM-dependent methyltransferase